MIKPGYSIIISQNGTVLYKRSRGYADIENDTKISSKTKFRLASLTKPFTIMLILYLIKMGKIKLLDPVAKYFPELPNWSNIVTIDNLLRHTSGIPDFEKVLQKRSFIKGQEPNNISALRVFTETKQLDFEPGTKQKYSESGYVLLALIIESTSGKQYAEYLYEAILQPLNMKDTLVFDKPNMKFTNRALGYASVGAKYNLFDYNPLNYIIGNEGIYSTPLDLCRFCNAWFTERILPFSLLDRIFLRTKLKNGSTVKRGYSFKIDSFKLILET